MSDIRKAVPILAHEPDGTIIRFESMSECVSFYDLPSRDRLVEAMMYDDTLRGLRFEFPADVPDSTEKRVYEAFLNHGNRKKAGR